MPNSLVKFQPDPTVETSEIDDFVLGVARKQNCTFLPLLLSDYGYIKPQNDDPTVKNEAICVPNMLVKF